RGRGSVGVSLAPCISETRPPGSVGATTHSLAVVARSATGARDFFRDATARERGGDNPLPRGRGSDGRQRRSGRAGSVSEGIFPYRNWVPCPRHDVVGMRPSPRISGGVSLAPCISETRPPGSVGATTHSLAVVA